MPGHPAPSVPAQFAGGGYIAGPEYRCRSTQPAPAAGGGQPAERERPLQLTPAIYEHAAGLIGRRPWEVSRSRELLVEAHTAAHACYGHRPVVAGDSVMGLSVNVGYFIIGVLDIGGEQGRVVAPVSADLFIAL